MKWGTQHIVVEKGKKNRNRRMFCMLLSTTRLSAFSWREVSESQQQGGENIESVLLPTLGSGVSVWCCKIGCKWKEKENMYKETITLSLQPLPFILPLPFAFLLFVFLSPLFWLLTAVIVSFSLSKNIVFLPRCKRGRIWHVCYLFIWESRERNLGGNQVS